MFGSLLLCVSVMLTEPKSFGLDLRQALYHELGLTDQERLFLESARKDAISTYRSMLRLLDERLRDQRYDQSDRVAIAEQKQEIQNVLAQIEAGGCYVPDLGIEDVELGRVGFVYGQVEILETVDDENMVIQRGYTRLWLKGKRRGMIVKKDRAVLDGFFRLRGTKTYHTAAGDTLQLKIVSMRPRDEIEAILESRDDSDGPAVCR